MLVLSMHVQLRIKHWFWNDNDIRNQKKSLNDPDFWTRHLKVNPGFHISNTTIKLVLRNSKKYFLCAFLPKLTKKPKKIVKQLFDKAHLSIGSCSYDGDVSVAVPDVVVPDGNVTQIFTELLELKKYEDGYQVVHKLYHFMCS